MPGALGCAGLVPRVESALASLGWKDYDALWLAAGTGTTLAGLVIGEAGRHRVFGALAGPPSHAVDAGVANLLAQAGMASSGYELLDASRGGFGRFDRELAQFILDTERQGGVPLDPIYTAKTMMDIAPLCRARLFSRRHAADIRPYRWTARAPCCSGPAAEAD